MPINYDDYKKKHKKSATYINERARKQREVSYKEQQKKKNYFADGYDFGDITKTIIGAFESNNKKNTDIAPVKRTWFDSGAFKDGYDFGDVTKTILGTTADIGVNVAKGITTAGEGLGKLFVGGVAEVSDLIGQDDYADKLRKRLAGKDDEFNKSYDTFSPTSNLNRLSNKVDSSSVIGEKSDDLVSSVGIMGAAAAGQSVGIPWYLTMGGSSAGNELENAYKSGATDGEAWGSAAITGASEVVFEKLGGIKFGGKALDTGLKRVLSEKITNGVAKNLTKAGIDIGTEGLEEVLTEVTSNIGKKLTYEDEKTWKEALASEEALDNYLESFIGGAVMGGGFNAGKTINSIKTGRDYDTGLTKNEQTVLDTVKNERVTETQKKRAIDEKINEAIKEQESTLGSLTPEAKLEIKNNVMQELENSSIDFSNNTLSKKEINKIEEEVRKDLEEGNLDIGTIENTLSPTKTAQIKELQEQIDKTTNEQEKAQIQAKINELQRDKATELKDLLNKDTFLQKSYQEANLRKEKFTYETKDTDSDYRKTLTKEFEDKGNNSTKAHNQYEMLVKLSEDKGVQYHVTNNAELSKLNNINKNINPSDIEGFVRTNKDGNKEILINIDSDRAINRIVGHETTHLFEGTKEYDELKDFAKQYATTKGEYDSRLKSTQELYKGVENANVENEVTANIVGDYIFTDTDFINNLSTEKPNIFKRVYEEVKHLYKMATAGSKEERQLLQLKKSFEKVYKNNASNTKIEGIEYSVGNNKTDTDIIRDSINESIKDVGDNGRFDYETENNDILWDQIYSNAERNLGRELTDEDYEIINDKIQDFSKDGFYIADDSYSLDEYSKVVNEKLNEVESKLEDQGYSVQESHSPYAGLVSSRYFEKDGVTVRIGDHNNGRGGEVLTREELWDMSTQDLVNFVNEQYESKTGNDTKYSLSNKGTLQDSEGNDVKLETSDTGTHGTLMAIHNLNEAKLKGILELGGFPVPSIAITNPDLVNHNQFGDISVLFDKSTIDPAVKANEVYDRDVWSPTFPTVDYNMDSTKLNEVSEKLGIRSYDLEDYADNNKTPEYLSDRLTRVEEIVDKYIKDNNIEYETAYKEQKMRKSFNENKKVQDWVKNNNADLWEMAHNESLRNEYYEIANIESDLRNGYEDAFIKYAYDNNKFVQPRLLWGLENDFNIIKNGVKQVIDEWQTNKNKKEAAINNGLKDYLVEQTKPLFSEKGIYNGKDYLTPSGNRRSFWQLHDEYNLENIVNNLTSQDTKGTQNWMAGYGQIQAQMSNRFNSIEDIKANENKLVNLSEENERLTNLRNEIESDIDEIYNNNDVEMWTVSELFADFAKGNLTIDNFRKLNNNYYQTIKNVSNEQINKIIKDLKELKDMPTDYFEAKPQRAVELDEIQQIVIPNTSSAEFKQQLQDAGIKYVEYDPSIEGDRNRVINQFDDLKFSLSNQNNQIVPSRNDIFGSDIKYQEKAKQQIEDVVAPLKEEVKTLTKEITDLKENIAPTPQEVVEQQREEAFNTLTEADVPAEAEINNDYIEDTSSMDNKSLKALSKNMRETLGLNRKQTTELESVIQDFSAREGATREELLDTIKDKFGTEKIETDLEDVKNIQRELKNTRLNVSQQVKTDIADYNKLRQKNFGKIRFSKDGLSVDQVYQELSNKYPDYFPEDVWNESDQFLQMVEVANMDKTSIEELAIPDEYMEEVSDYIYDSIQDYKFDEYKKATLEQSRIPIDESLIPTEEETYNPVNNASNSEQTIAESEALETTIDTDENLTIKEKNKLKLKNYETLLNSLQEQKLQSYDDFNQEIHSKINQYADLKNKNTIKANNLQQQIETLELRRDNVQLKYDSRIENTNKRIESMNTPEFKEKELTATRKELQEQHIEAIKNKFHEQGFDFDEVLDNAKNKSTLASVDNTPQRFIEKTIGYKEGQILNDLTVNKEALNESEATKWLNSFTDRKNGEIAKISKQYNIKPRSKESAAAQMYGEGFYVNDKEELVKYGDEELAKDFPDTKTQENIKALAKDPRIRQIYDDTLVKINEARERNGYKPIPKRENYFLHFREMEDTFSRIGLPFNPESIKASDLPTDMAGMTVDLKPGQPYFASSKQRKGNKTTYDLLGGLEKYLGSAKNQIYHIDDIQVLRSLRNYLADKYGQAKGLENLDTMTPEQQDARIKEVYNSHLSNFAKFFNEQANILAGKTSLMDRSVEGIFGRRALRVLDTINQQVGKNMVGFNVSSAATGFIPITQAAAKLKKSDLLKAFAQTTSNKVSNIFGKDDGFVENDPGLVRRKGIERFTRTPIEKISDTGYALMSGIDNLASEVIVRAKYNELTRNGMNSEQAHIRAGEWAMRILGDRSLGQMPQLYNSKTLGILTKFQLEVRNQLDAQFYDTVQDAKLSTEEIENGLKRNTIKATKITSTIGQLAIFQHLFGKAFESVAGYNPAFDMLGVIMTAFGFDDDDDSEDTIGDNIEQAFSDLLGDLPYASTLTGGRIPISSALPIEQLVTGKDDYGNEKSRLKTLGEAIPYYILPGGYGQIKKTQAGLKMFDDDLPVAGSYTDSGNLRFPIEDTLKNRVQAAVFGQWASENARDYFNNERKPLKDKQIQEYKDLDIPIKDYWKYRDELKDKKSLEDKFDYINSLDLPVSKKNTMVNNVVKRKEEIDLSNYNDFANYEEFDWASKNPEKYAIAKSIGDVTTYRQLTDELDDIKADKKANGKSISGSRKTKVIDYIKGLDLDEGSKLILYKSEYKSDNSVNYGIIDYLNSRDDITYDEMNTIVKKLGMTVDSNGNIRW